MEEQAAELPQELIEEIHTLIEPDIAEMKAWKKSKINAAKAAGEKM